MNLSLITLFWRMQNWSCFKLIAHYFWSLFWLPRVPIWSPVHEKVGPYFKLGCPWKKECISFEANQVTWSQVNRKIKSDHIPKKLPLLYHENRVSILKLRGFFLKFQQCIQERIAVPNSVGNCAKAGSLLSILLTMDGPHPNNFLYRSWAPRVIFLWCPPSG